MHTRVYPNLDPDYTLCIFCRINMTDHCTQKENFMLKTRFPWLRWLRKVPLDNSFLKMHSRVYTNLDPDNTLCLFCIIYITDHCTQKGKCFVKDTFPWLRWLRWSTSKQFVPKMHTRVYPNLDPDYTLYIFCRIYITDHCTQKENFMLKTRFPWPRWLR